MSNINNWLDEGEKLLIKDNVIYEKTTIETTLYEEVNGKKPRGNKEKWGFIFPKEITKKQISEANKSTLRFTMNENTLYFNGKLYWSEAKKTILQIGKELKINNIRVAS